ncbi:MAG TPA: MFS transporter [Candidatus Acidoferrales bacterium]|nr:MFS transporter [Candidatus Acidoferrales bacterium]
MRGRLFYGWILVVALGLTTIVSYGTTQYLFGVLVVPIHQELGWSRAAISGAYSTSIVLAGLLGFPVGRLADRRGARGLMSLGSLLGAGCLFGLSQARELWQFYLLWAGGLGLAMALTLYPVTFIVVTNWFVRRRGTAMALLTVLGGISSPIYIPVAGLLVARAGWRETLVVMAFTQLLLALPLHALVLRRHPEDVGLHPDGLPAPVTSAGPGAGLSLRESLRRPAFWLVTLAVGLSGMGVSVVHAHQVAYMISRGFDPVLAATVAGMVGLASLPGRFLINLLSDRLAPRQLLALGTALQGAGIVVLALAATPALLWAYVVVFGAAFGANASLRASVMAEHFGRRAYGAVTALQGIPVAVLAGLGPLLAGALYDRLGGYSLALWLTAAAFGIGGLVMLLTPRPPAGRVFAPEPAPAAA